MDTTAVPWSAFASAAPQLALFTKARIDARVAYLATVRRDGGPRVHPITPIVAETQVFVFMEPTSPKGHDLKRDGRYALHCAVEDSSGGEGEVYLHGRARQVDAPEERAIAVAASSYTPKEQYILFELLLERVVVTRYTADGVARERWEVG